MTNHHAISLLSNLYLPYPHYIDEEREALSFAINMLKAQEPRVLTLDEVKALELPADVFIERSHAINYPTTIYAATITGIGTKGFSTYHDSLDFRDYNRTPFNYRIWSTRPTDEQREAVKWDD